jgi:uncharacterized protein involved in outer membrane biogenesis
MKRIIKFVVIPIAVLAVAGVATMQVASRVVVARIESMLGPEGHAQDIDVGWNRVILKNVEIGAPPGWPAQQTLRAARVELEPDWSALLSNRIAIRRATLEDYYLSVLRTTDGRLRILPTIQERTGKSEDGAVEGGSDNDGDKRKREVWVGRLVLEKGHLDFFDATVAKQPYRIPIDDLHADIGPLRAPAGADQTKLVLTGKLTGKKRSGTLNMDGWVVQSTKDSDVRTTLQGADVSLLAPYLQKHAPAALVGGQLDLNMRTRVASQRLNAQGTVTLQDLAFDNSGSTLLSLPRKAVLAALEDRKGKVTFDFTIEGNLHDPKFSLNDDISMRLAGGFAKAIGVSVEGVAGGVGGAVKGLGDTLNQIFGK